MKKLSKIALFSFTAMLGLSVLAGVGLADSALAGTAADAIRGGSDSVGGTDNSVTVEEGIKTVVNVLIFLIGAIAVIMIIIGGIRYVTSNGDANSTKGAKDTILYAVIGIIVAILAYAIVNFVIDAFSGAPS